MEYVLKKEKTNHERKVLPFSLLWSGNEAFFLIAFTKINADL
jgi:hypothetical protein